MTEQINAMRLLDNPPARRLWLLLEAMRSLPFDRAVELARIAETFVTGSAIETTSHEPVRPAATPSVNPAEPKESIDQISTSATVPADRPTEPERLPRLMMSETACWIGLRRARAMRSSRPSSAYPRSRFRSCAWVALAG